MFTSRAQRKRRIIVALQHHRPAEDARPVELERRLARMS